MQSDKNQNDIVKSFVTKLNYVEDYYSDSSQNTLVRETSDESSVNSVQKNSTGSNSRSHDKQQILLADSSMMMMGVTQYEAVQVVHSFSPIIFLPRRAPSLIVAPLLQKSP